MNSVASQDAADRLRDKDYLTTADGLFFNVIGYDHELDRATANLKYVHGTKWTAGYDAAVAFLAKEYPNYVRGLISVPRSLVTKIHRPQEGLRRLRSQADRNGLEQTAVDLAQECSDVFEIPLGRFGVTDSLLWGRGGNNSDIDLVVYGSDSALIVLDRIKSLYRRTRFERLRVENFTRQSTMRSAGVADLCRRKMNKGLYQGVRFSLRAVREWNEIESAERFSFTAQGTVEVNARVADNSQSLFFPAMYQLDSGLDLVSFLMEYEAVFTPGDSLKVKGTLEVGARNRIVVGSLLRQDHSISWQ